MKKTIAAWLVAITFLLAYEGYALLNSTPGDTLSEAVWKHGQHPMIWLAVGMLLGHFIFTKRKCEWCGKNPYRKAPDA